MAKQPRECDERVSSAMSASTRAGERGREGLHGQLGAIVGVVGAHHLRDRHEWHMREI